MSVELVKGYSSVISLLHIYIFVVALSSSFLILDWRVLSFESTCDFHIFFPRLIAWFSCVVCVQKRGRKRLCVYVYCRLFAQSRLLVLIRNVFIFVLSLKKRQKEREREKKKMQKDLYRIFVDFLFLFSFFFKYSFLSSFLIGIRKTETQWYINVWYRY